MGIVNPPIPTLGDLNASEDPDIRNALIALRDEINGLLDDANIKPGANLDGSKFKVGSIAGDRLILGGGYQIAHFKHLVADATSFANNPSWTDLASEFQYTTPTAITNPIVVGIIECEFTSASSVNDNISCSLMVGGTREPANIVFVARADTLVRRYTQMQIWYPQTTFSGNVHTGVPGGTLLKLQAQKTSGISTYHFSQQNSKMIVLQPA